MKKPEELIEVEKLEKQLGNEKFSKLLDEWEKEHKKFRVKWQELYEQEKKEIFSHKLWKKIETGELKYEDLVKVTGGQELKTRLDEIEKQMRVVSKPEAEIGEKLRWSRMTPENREVELRVNERIASDEAEIRKFEEKLSMKERDIRADVMSLLAHCRMAMTEYIGGTEKEVEKQQDALEKRARQLMEKVLKTSNEKLDLIEKVFHHKDFFKFDYFKMLYEDYKKGNPMVIIFVHFDKKK